MEHRRSTSVSSQTNSSLPPLTVWLVTINSDVSREEFQRFYQSLPPALRKNYKHLTARQDSATLKTIICDLLPRILMKYHSIPEDRWTVSRTDSGKAYIESPDLSRRTRKIMGLNIAIESHVVGFAFAFGRKHQVVNIGIDMMMIPPPSGTDAEKFLESHMHKLSPVEESFVVPALAAEVKLRRLCIMLTLKQAYTRALGQPPGFDLSRIECNVPHALSVDGRVQLGWEFRLFRANVAVARAGGKLGSETYQCACAIFRGWKDRSEFRFTDPTKDADAHAPGPWLSLATVQQVAHRAAQQYAEGERPAEFSP